MGKLFISHSSQDDGFVCGLQQVLGDLRQDVWIDSRELRGGDLLWPEIKKAIEEASAYAVVVSPASLQSEWVGDELAQALELQKQRGRDKYPVVPLSLDGTKLGVLKRLFGEEPLYIPVSSDAGGIDAALNAILVAIGKRLPVDVPVAAQPKAEPLEELVLEFTDLKLHEDGGVRRASARARLVYEPATPGQREVASAQSWRFVAPLGPIEAEELRWYLEKYAIWPSEYFRDRARKVVKWGQLLHAAAMPVAHTANVMKAWARIDDHAGRRFSVYVDVDAALEAGAPAADAETAREAATLLLGLPWELLHDGKSFLFQGATPTRVRRRLPNTQEGLEAPVVATPIRILLVTARPEDDACGYIDHRASALPLVEAMEDLGGLVRLHVLRPPMLPALREELDRARTARESYHVVHFDGHGVYDRQVGLGGLCFEDPQDIGKLDKRRHKTIFTRDLGPLLRDHHIPLVFLEACQTAQAEKASESVASELLKIGVASVVAMSHSVLVETARRFVKAFYRALARGDRVGDAMLDGQRKSKENTFRGRIFGALLAPALRSRGVEATRTTLIELMAEMERKFPRSREQSVFASVELSLRRLSPANQEKARVLGVFHGGVDLDVLRTMMQWENADVASLAGELITTGLATPNRYNHLTLNPALRPYLRGQMDAAEHEALTARWAEAMRGYVEFLVQQCSQNTEIATTLTVLELPNLFTLLEQVQRAGDAEATIALATSLFGLLQWGGRPRLVERVAQVRDAAAAALGETWNHARFEAQATRIKQQLAGGRLRGLSRRAAVAPARPGDG